MNKKDLQNTIREFLLKNGNSPITEANLTKAQLDKREDYLKQLKKNKKELVKRYGKDAESVMYGRATNLAKKAVSEMNKEKLKELVRKSLMNENKEFSEEEIKDYMNTFNVSREEAIKGLQQSYEDYKSEMGEGKKSFPDLTGDGKVTKADILKGRGVDLDEDIDLGHEDNEPHMIKGELYQIGKYAMDLYAILEELEEKGGEYDFPAWWQSKITTAKNMMSGAKHYLDFELKEPAIDAAVDALTGEEPHMGEPMPPMMNEDERAILDQVRNKLLGLFQPYGDFQILDMTMKGQNTGENFRLYAKSKGANWKGLENFMRNNPDFTIKHISKQTFDNPKSIDFSYKTSMMNEDEVTKTDKLAAKIFKALKDPKNKSAEDQNNIKQARKAMNKGDEKAAEKIIDPYLEEGLPKGFWDKKMKAKDETNESYETLKKKIQGQGKSAKAAGAIAGAVAAYKAKGGGTGPTAKQKK